MVGQTHTKAEAEQLRKLISDWKIDFESATTIDDWHVMCLPNQHLFEQILNIKRVAFVDYPGERHTNQAAAVQKKLLVKKLQANAWRCSQERDNEAGWVNNIANLVFESLHGFDFLW